jgi:HAE1 family hydrophobic/amphiphilic exporter-1
VFGGMLAATILTLIFVPVFYAVIETMRERYIGHDETALKGGHAPAE